jgi:hypothetical protein
VIARLTVFYKRVGKNAGVDAAPAPPVTISNFL